MSAEKKVDIVFNNVSKNYFLCKNDFERLQTLLLPFTRKKRTKVALQNISFEIYQGEKVALIGKNGAGKSTILKIISNIVTPSSGDFKVNRRVSTLLDVAAGIENDFTGRENIYFRGILLGCSKKEIKAAIPRIIEFAQLEEYIDMEMKRYSAGMVAKLGFSINLFLNPQILIVDEALSVGDVEFNNRAKKEINKLCKEKKLTVIIVSHNETTLKNLCTRGIYIKDHHVAFDGNIDKCLQYYNKDTAKQEHKTTKK